MASHIGHTGKTTMTFQLACYFAKQNPGVRVLVMDFAEEGDLTKRMVGGCDAATSDKAKERFGGIFKILDDAKSSTSGANNWLWSKTVDIAGAAWQVSTENPAIPSNVYLLSSGAWPSAEPEMGVAERKKIVNTIRDSLQKSEHTWKLFCDTDGDRRPSFFTKIAYGLCPQAIVPLHVNKADLDRTETMLGILAGLRDAGEISTQVQLIIWNLVQVNKNEPSDYKFGALPFTPTKVNVSILEACNERILGLRAQCPGLFVHEGASDNDFVQNSTIIIRQLADTMLRPSEELGKPFVSMVEELGGKKSVKFKTGGVEYESAAKVVEEVDAAMRNLQEKFEAMSVARS